MTRDYSQVGVPGGTATAGGGRSRRPLWIAAVVGVVLLVIVAVLAVSCSGSDDTATTSSQSTTSSGIGSPHGPNKITDGIPSGYTRDKAGAATAAVNFMQAVSQAGQGRIDAGKLTDQSVASNPSPALSQVLSQASGRAADSAVYSSMPVVTTVTSFDPNTAVVSIWELDSSQSRIGGQNGKVGVQTLWSTTTVTLSWSGSDWKASDWSFKAGPNPADATFPAADSPLAQKATGGYYSFYIN